MAWSFEDGCWKPGPPDSELGTETLAEGSGQWAFVESSLFVVVLRCCRKFTPTLRVLKQQYVTCLTGLLGDQEPGSGWVHESGCNTRRLLGFWPGSPCFGAGWLPSKVAHLRVSKLVLPVAEAPVPSMWLGLPPIVRGVWIPKTNVLTSRERGRESQEEAESFLRLSIGNQVRSTFRRVHQSGAPAPV